MKKSILFAALLAVACRPIKTDTPDIVVDDHTEVISDGDMAEKAEEPKVYQATNTVYTDLIHTKLEVSFDWAKSQMKGKETLTAKPHFYASDSLILDAKAMEIKTVSINGAGLKYNYADDKLRIKLDKTYTRNDRYTIVIDYIARPEEREAGGSDAISSDKGLYFINPTGADKAKMPQIWTQGETQANSVWFPTVDSPNQKSTEEIFITVEDKYLTLSNGKMIESKKNADGTRTDHWKQDLPHSMYLFMLAVGEFKLVKDTYKRPDGSLMEVNYIVEPEWEQYAKNIFGETPEMIRFFSQLTGVEYAWDKYSQIVVRDYVSGAMENTGAVVFGDFVYKTDRELLDENDRSTIAHELFHHWFGDYVTCESWSNLTLNESWANYSQYLWDEHRDGLDEADYQAKQEMEGYMQSAEQAGYHDLVWFDYDSREDMFDGHTYNKGGRILHMLRNYLGDEAFFAGMKLYLSTNAFKAAEYNQLRIAFEEVSGQDLNWFFKEWYLDEGHPTLNYTIADKGNGTVSLNVTQTQDFTQFPVFNMPVDVAVFDGNGTTVHRIWVNEKENSYEFPYSGELKNVIFDNQQMLLAVKKETKDPKYYVHQYYNGKRWAARLDGLKSGAAAEASLSDKLILDALKDPFWDIRSEAVSMVSRLKGDNEVLAVNQLKEMVKNDPNSDVRVAVVSALSKKMTGTDKQAMLEDRINNDKSYAVISKALSELNKVNSQSAMAIAKALETEKSSKMLSSVAQIYASTAGPEKFDFYKRILTTGAVQGYDAIGAGNAFTYYISRQDDLRTVNKSVEVFQYLADNGGMYTQMFMPQYMNYLKNALNTKISKYDEEITNAKSSNNEAAKTTAENNKAEAQSILAAFERIAAASAKSDSEE